MTTRRRVLAGTAGVLLIAGLVGNQRVPVGTLAAVFTGGSAKMLCTDVFVAGRDPDLAFQQDFRRLTKPGTYLGMVDVDVDVDAGSVTADIWGLASRTAIHREGIGCTTAEGTSVAALRAQGEGARSTLENADASLPWPEGSAVDLSADVAGVDVDAIREAVDAVFDEPEPDRPRNSRGVVVVHGGRIIAERHAPGFDENTAHLSNSVAKSVTATLIGILVGQGRLQVSEPAPITSWHAPGDPRREITLDHLLHMTSGLEFEESYDKIKSDITMQYSGGDLSGHAIDKPLVAPPGSRWSYSTGTANILGRIVREAAGPDLSDGFAFPRRALFDPLGMRTAVLEVDTSGNFVGGSSFYASVRDYARLGLLHLRDGVWQGERILPEGWVEYVTTPTPLSPSSSPYGAQFWLNDDGSGQPARHSRLPADAYLMNGHQGQHVVVIPSLDLVVVRVGLSEFDTWDIEDLVAPIVDAFRDA